MRLRKWIAGTAIVLRVRVRCLLGRDLTKPAVDDVSIPPGVPPGGVPGGPDGLGVPVRLGAGVLLGAGSGFGEGAAVDDGRGAGAVGDRDGCVVRCGGGGTYGAAGIEAWPRLAVGVARGLVLWLALILGDAVAVTMTAGGGGLFTR